VKEQLQCHARSLGDKLLSGMVFADPPLPEVYR